MDVKELNGELNQLREDFLKRKITRRQFVTRLAKFGLAAPVAIHVMGVSRFFNTPTAEAAEELMSLQMLEPIKMRDNSKFKTKPPWKIGFANPGMNNPWRVCFQACVDYQRSLTSEIGEFIQTDAGEKAEKQINDIEDLMSKGLNLIMVNPVTSEAMIPIMEKLWEKPASSVTLDRWVETEKVTCRTSSEHQTIVGRSLCRLYRERIWVRRRQSGMDRLD
jgi:ABC-type sugar transport system substrate-binding protein